MDFLQSPPTPERTFDWECEVEGLVREFGQQIVQATYNQVERQHAPPARVEYECGEYTRQKRPTPNRHVATRFGTIALWRHGYRYVDRAVSEPLIFPLEKALGLVEGVTPALAERAARAMSEAGATQATVLERLRDEHGVTLGVKRLRLLVAQIETRMTPHRRRRQVEQVVEWLHAAEESSGPNRPVLSVGRDGVTLATRPHGFFEVATVGTLTVYDRRRQRLGSVYVAQAPELGQAAMSDELTALMKETLAARRDTLPRVAYLTDAGATECGYFHGTLRKLRDPQTGQKLKWFRILDYYHAASRLTTMGETLFGDDTRAVATWTAKMRKLLKRPRGVFRVLHSAAALRARRTLSASRRRDFQRAYRYLRDRSRHLRYHDYRRLGLPIGSGVTEAACKTLFTQRLKLSGMRWSAAGAQTILNLRSIRLSGVWEAAYRDGLLSRNADLPRTHARNTPHPLAIAA